MWQVTAAMIGIAFVALILIVETIHRLARTDYLWTSFFQSSRLVPVTLFLVTLVISIGIDALLLSPTLADELDLAHRQNLVLLDTVFFIASVCGLLTLYWDAFRVLSPGYSLRLASTTLDRLIVRSLRVQLYTRIAERLLTAECEQLGLTFDKASWRFTNLAEVKLKRTGFVTDVNLKTLRQVSKAIRRPNEGRTAVVPLCIGSEVGKVGEPGLLVHPDDLEAAEQMVHHCFRLGRSQPGPSRRTLDNAFSFLTEQGLAAISAGQSEGLNSVLDHFLGVVERTLANFATYGIHFNADLTRQIFPFEWPVLDRPFREFRRLIEFASTTNDREALTDLMYWPTRVMRMSVDLEDFFFFDQAVSNFPTYLFLARDASPRAVSLLKNRSWTHLREFGYELSARLEGAKDRNVVDALSDYWKRIFSAYVQILRHALETNDAQTLKDAASGYWKMLNEHMLGDAIGIHVDRTQPKGYFGQTQEPASQKAEALINILDRRDAVWFALGGWFMYLWSNNELSPEQSSALFALMGEPFRDFRLAWRGFASAMEAESSDRLPLSDWQMSRLESETVHFINSPQYLALFFASLALPTVGNETHEKLSNLAELKQASWVSGHVESALTSIESDFDRWRPLLGETMNLPEKVTALRNVMQAANAKEDEQERQAIIRQSISSVKLADFQTEFLVEWQRGGLMRRLFDGVGGIRYVAEKRPDKRIVGIYVVLPKSAFVEDAGRTHWLGLAENFARAFTDAENKAVVSAIIRNAAAVRGIDAENVEAGLSEAIEDIREEHGSPAILMGYRWESRQLVENLPEFVPSWRLRDGEDGTLAGRFRDIPVHVSVDDKAQNELIVVDLKAIGEFVQYLGDGDSIFTRFDVKEYSEEDAQSAAEGDRSWLGEKERQLETKELVEYLRENVWLRIDESFDFEVQMPKAAIRLRLNQRRRSRKSD